ncbi:hypothetical protein DFQ30_008045 [Apophysomyces sp. BC1015]|nr:hypothetical protein DFQ30_008045 [Apophysomyces sp. BC1015]
MYQRSESCKEADDENDNGHLTMFDRSFSSIDDSPRSSMKKIYKAAAISMDDIKREERWIIRTSDDEEVDVTQMLAEWRMVMYCQTSEFQAGFTHLVRITILL